jgi:hypothetical protein
MTEKNDRETPAPPATRPEHETLAEKLKAGKLDLEVEEVEERISPSETNVFDK